MRVVCEENVRVWELLEIMGGGNEKRWRWWVKKLSDTRGVKSIVCSREPRARAIGATRYPSIQTSIYESPPLADYDVDKRSHGH